jgi:hypothetical protein
MSSVIHPVGPEPEQTYWRRRLVVVAAAVLLVALVVALVVGGTSTGSAVSAAPSPSPVGVPPAVTLTPTPVPSPSVTPSPSASPSGGATASPTASPSPSGSAPTRAKSAESTKAASPTPSAKPTKKAPVACSPKDLRATLTGKQKLKPKQPTTFALSLINGSGATCIVTVDRAGFELKIYSGSDRIWSSKDCSTAVKTRSTKLKAEEAVQWSMRWDGRRSRKDCKDRPEVPRAGTYFATAQLHGAKPVQLRLILRG